jgi:tight adherence protein C
MQMEVIIGSAAVATALPILWYSVAASRSSRSGRNLRGDSTSAFAEAADLRELSLQRGAGERVVGPFVKSMAGRFRKITPIGMVEKLERRLELAGLTYRWPVERVLVMKFLLAVGVLAVGLATPLRDLPFVPVMTALMAVVGFFLPDAMVARRAEERQAQITRELPDALDQITMSVNAGVGFEGALAKAAKSGTGAFAEELNRMMQEMQVGVGRTEALRNLGDRTDVSDLRSFIFSVTQAENYGLPITQVLQVQAAELRDKRKQRAEERALKIPVLLIFPLAFCIFPAMFVVLLGPAAIRIFRDLGPAINP